MRAPFLGDMMGTTQGQGDDRHVKGVAMTENDAYVFGVRATRNDGTKGPARKPTKWMTSAPKLVEHLSKTHNGQHDRLKLWGANGAAQASAYPPVLVEAIARGLQAQREADHRKGRADRPFISEIMQTMTSDERQVKTLTKDKATYEEHAGELLNADVAQTGKGDELVYSENKNALSRARCTDETAGFGEEWLGLLYQGRRAEP